MQYSSNSDAAMRALIRARPTLIGQFRQAKLEMFRRSQDLQSVSFQLRRDEQELRLAEIAVEEMDAIASSEKVECQRQLALISAEEMAVKLQTTSELAADTKRELQVCADELERICAEGRSLLNVDLESISEAQFQALMAEEFKAKRSRFFAAQILAPQMGISAGAIEEFMEIPEEERQEIMELQSSYIQSYIGALPTQQLTD